ncbi:PKD domain-containing protein [Thiospirillum jenense]|uniref:PKD domain-containing protein n=1 Tax=Thiospirillum jenense TaxID=1653858 RepID=A0A839HIH4_9GAMM|nr:PKD domain-containing protein [Thiospirillum jenense]MBB1126718.1 PKD domain-containing protein [Thiospirillum jenense]
MQSLKAINHRYIIVSGLFSLTLLAGQPTMATTFYVATTGNDAADGTVNTPWRTISRATQHALQPGDQVLIQPGTYPEAIALTHSGAEVVSVTSGVSIVNTDTLRFPLGTDVPALDLTNHPDEYYLYVYRSWRANSGVFKIIATGQDAQGDWVQVVGANFINETGVSGDPRYLSAAIGRPIVFRNAATDPTTQRVILDASSKPSIYTMLYIGQAINDADAEPTNWNLIDGLDLTGSHQGGGVHLQDSSFNVVMNSRVYNLNGAGILFAGNVDDSARYNMILNNVIYNTPTEGIYIGAGGHGENANDTQFTHIIGNDISTQGTAANAQLENAIDLKEYNDGDLVVGNLIHDYALISPYNGALDIRDGKQDVLVYNNTFRNISKANPAASSVIHLYAGSHDIQIFNNVLIDQVGGGNDLYAFNVDGGGSTAVLIANNSIQGYGQGLLLEQYGGNTDVRFINNAFNFGSNGDIIEWGDSGRFTFSHNLYTVAPNTYANEPNRLVATPQWNSALQPYADSPLINSGIALVDITIDAVRTERPQNNFLDRGAYEVPNDYSPPPAILPQAEFNASPLNGIAPLIVQFTDQSQNATAWLWDFGDGNTATTASPSHVFNTPGNYTVSLTVSNANGTDVRIKNDFVQVTAEESTEEMALIFADEFETGLTDWYREGRVSWYSGDPKQGQHAMRFTGNNIWVERTISTAGFTDIQLSVFMGAASFENWEYLILYWSDGTTWYEPVIIDNHHAASDGQLHEITVNLPATAANNPHFRVAFGMWDTDTKDFAYIDTLRIVGKAMTP